MPTVLVLDVSLSMALPIPRGEGLSSSAADSRFDLAKHALLCLVQHLGQHLPHDFCSLVW